MKEISRSLFRAIHEGKWLSIEYLNKAEHVTKYWIGIQRLSPSTKTLTVEGLHLGNLSSCELNIRVEGIRSCRLLEGTYYPINADLVADIAACPEKYSGLFQNIPNLKVLSYLADCHRLDCTPYCCEYTLIQKLDEDRLAVGDYSLKEDQFREIVRYFQYQCQKEKQPVHSKQLAINVLSVSTARGLYVLAYRKLFLNAATRALTVDEEITLCKEFTIHGERQSIHQFLDAADLELLEDLPHNLELIKDVICSSNSRLNGINDLPYVLAIGRDVVLDLDAEYDAILKSYQENTATIPLQAFFGDLTHLPQRRKVYPITLIDRKINLDQLLAIHNAMKYPAAYVQGPPGTGKTNTILNTILTAFFNERSVLFTSYNNHPIDEVLKKLQGLQYHGKPIPFPVIRLGNNKKTAQGLAMAKQLYEATKNIQIYAATLEKNKSDKIQRMQKLSELLARYDRVLDLRERRATINRLLESRTHLTFHTELFGRQLPQINKELNQIGSISTEDALALLEDEPHEFLKYLFYTGAKYIKRLDEPKNEDLRNILYIEEEEEQVQVFNQFLQQEENLKKFLRIFPIVLTTCLSAYRLGKPKPHFDMVIMDEASQCNTAVALVPILRGQQLMLVGDPQQLNPVILLDESNNHLLRKKYGVSKEYDYIQNSIYKTYLACDSVSDEILLRAHYRCHKKIITFNNEKYYNGKLKILSESSGETPLMLVDVPDEGGEQKNTAPLEAEEVVRQAMELRRSQKEVGIITPFVNQKNLINSLLREYEAEDITCGTVHAFQGDEKDVILFSPAITADTYGKTYDWLKTNKELLNVATSRAKEQLIMACDVQSIQRLHGAEAEDDLYELMEYVRTNGTSYVSRKAAVTRALGVKPYSTETEAAFLETLNHALDNLFDGPQKYVIHKEVPISHVFGENFSDNGLFYTGRFDFVVYEKLSSRRELPVLAIELDGKEHFDSEVVRARDAKKNAICQNHGFQLIRIENTYARRYHYIKEILISYFT